MDLLDYGRTKLFTNTKYDFILFFENKSHDVIEVYNIDYIGKPGIQKDNIQDLENPEYLLSMRRFLIYESEIISMVVYVWD